MKNSPFKIGQAVVYTAPNGDSHSATVCSVDRLGVVVAWRESLRTVRKAAVPAGELSRLVPFGKSLFLAL